MESGTPPEEFPPKVCSRKPVEVRNIANTIARMATLANASAIGSFDRHPRALLRPATTAAACQGRQSSSGSADAKKGKAPGKGETGKGQGKGRQGCGRQSGAGALLGRQRAAVSD